MSGQHSDICPPNVLMMSSPCPHKLLLQNLLPHHQHHECINRPLIIFNHNSLLANPTCSSFFLLLVIFCHQCRLSMSVPYLVLNLLISTSQSFLVFLQAAFPSLQLRKNGLYRKNKFFLQQKYPKQLIDIVI